MKDYNFKTLKRINKTAAKKLYNAGADVLFIPCKLNPENNFYCLGIWENNQLAGQYETFEKLCNAFSWYNCRSDTGNYIAFYIKREDAAQC